MERTILPLSGGEETAVGGLSSERSSLSCGVQRAEMVVFLLLGVGDEMLQEAACFSMRILINVGATGFVECGVAFLCCACSRLRE